MNQLGRTAWVDRHYTKFWDEISAKVKPAWLPLNMDPGGMDVEEYGCGAYGCVSPTQDPNVVVKLTSDPSEAHFIAAALRLREWPESRGIVEYYAVYQLQSTYRQRPVFVTWRQAAHDIGLHSLEMSGGGGPANQTVYVRRQIVEQRKLLRSFKFSADTIRGLMKNAARGAPYALVKAAAEYEQWAFQNASPSAPTPPAMAVPQRLAYHWRLCEVYVELMENTYLSDTIGDALGFYMSKGLLLADVHQDNVGLVDDSDYRLGRIVITDPGHAVPLRPELETVEIEVL